MADRVIGAAELSRHGRLDDAWIAVGDDVLDVTKFARLHPGGVQWIEQSAGKDVTNDFLLYHGADVRRKYFSRLRVGRYQGGKQPPPTPPGCFGDLVPYGDPDWYQGFRSPYYGESHRRWREHVRRVLDEGVFPTLHEWRNASRPPAAVSQLLGQTGLLAAMTGVAAAPTFAPAAAKEHIPRDLDVFHELILFDELARCGDAGVVAALSTGPAIALPMLLRRGNSGLTDTVARAVLAGDAFVALAVSEPNAGSDVASLATTARRDGDFYVVNGSKKFITHGTYASYFVTAVRTGGKGHGGVSVLLIDSKTPGVSTRKLDVRSSPPAGTAYINFRNVRVPAQNLIGKEGEGFSLIMQGFNHERVWHCVLCARLARVCLEECLKYSLRRQTFGKYLHEHQAIRMKLASMAREVEQLWHWLEHLAYQIQQMSPKEAMAKLGGPTALVKAQTSKVYERCAREATMIFGGNALVAGSAGWKIENAVAQVKAYQIPAGAEDVMDDFAARDMVKRAASARL
eukprot:TRINITY_DN19687_c0_g1_i1.p1 TRINITY_DN19687_c0_g1~~TRINITY_DN19687_c0_g1_i1.p1  ORF type:complete len:529 (+),score=169.70 TRINITY_DN19687_c0_g1_i1:47-1588(+)